jgi:hypothetical protein
MVQDLAKLKIWLKSGRGDGVNWGEMAIAQAFVKINTALDQYWVLTAARGRWTSLGTSVARSVGNC